MELMTQAAFARFVSESYSHSMTRQAVNKSPNVVRDAKGKIRVAESLKALEASGAISLDDISENIPSPPKQLTLTSSAAVSSVPPADRERTFYEEKARTELITREIQAIKLDQMKGKLIDVALVSDAMVTAGRKIRDQIGHMITISDQLAAAGKEGGVDAVRDVLAESIRKIQDDLANTLSLMGDEGDKNEIQ